MTKKAVIPPHIAKKLPVIGIAVLTAAVLLSIVAGSVMIMAKYVHSSNLIEDYYQPDFYDRPQISDVMTKNEKGFFEKSCLTVTPADSTDYPVYVRVSLVPVWQDDSGNIYGQQPVLNRDYTLNYNENDWFCGTDGYYYCTKRITGGEAAPMLLTENEKLCQIKAAPRKGFHLHVLAAAETIQAIGTTDVNHVPAVAEAWGLHPAAAE